MKLVLFVPGGVLLVLTLLARLRSERWWIRFADYPRLQIAIGLAVVLILHAALVGWGTSLDIGFGLALSAALAYHVIRIVPYTRLAPQQVKTAKSRDPSRCLRLLTSNVLMENRTSDRLLKLIREMEPDLVLLLETDEWWREQLEVLDQDYPFRLKQPQGNYYGLHFFSKLELRSPEVCFLVEDEIPSVRAGVRLRSGNWIEFYGLHPRPPQVEEDTETRDAEILIVGREIREDGRPSIVAGDLNDVAWSHTTRLFQRISGCLDPRRGRGMFNTFHADHPLFRWPLDHIFHEPSFTLVRIERLPHIGSDHFPVFVELCFELAVAALHEDLEPARKDIREAREKVREGQEAARVSGFACRSSAAPIQEP